MKKYFWIIPIVLLLFGCQKKIQNNNDIDNFVKDSSYIIVSNRIDSTITNLLMFPNQKSEDDLIYYVKAILKNKDKFTDEELSALYRKLDMSYQFEFNSFGYTNDDYNIDLKEIRDNIDK